MSYSQEVSTRVRTQHQRQGRTASQVMPLTMSLSLIPAVMHRFPFPGSLSLFSRSGLSLLCHSWSFPTSSVVLLAVSITDYLPFLFFILLFLPFLSPFSVSIVPSSPLPTKAPCPKELFPINSWLLRTRQSRKAGGP